MNENEKPFHKWDREEYYPTLIKMILKSKLVPTEGRILHYSKIAAWEASAKSNGNVDLLIKNANLDRINRALNELLLEQEATLEKMEHVRFQLEAEIAQLKTDAQYKSLPPRPRAEVFFGETAQRKKK